MKVLLTDDSTAIRMIVRGLLAEVGIDDIDESGDGQQTLALLDHSSYDMIFLDIHMPKMDGLHCLEQIKAREDTRNLPIVIISSDTDYRQLQRAKQLGAFGYIKKPFKAKALRNAIKAAFASRQQALQRQAQADVGESSTPATLPAAKTKASPQSTTMTQRKRSGLVGWLRQIFTGS